MSVTYGNEFQPSLRDLVYSRSAPNAEALGYCRPVPPGRKSRRVSNGIQPRTSKTIAPLVSPQSGYSFVTHPKRVSPEVSDRQSRKQLHSASSRLKRRLLGSPRASPMKAKTKLPRSRQGITSTFRK